MICTFIKGQYHRFIIEFHLPLESTIQLLVFQLWMIYHAKYLSSLVCLAIWEHCDALYFIDWWQQTGKRRRQEGGRKTVLSMTSSSSLNPQEEQRFLPLKLLQHSSTDNNTKGSLVRKIGRNTPVSQSMYEHTVYLHQQSVLMLWLIGVYSNVLLYTLTFIERAAWKDRYLLNAQHYPSTQASCPRGFAAV